MLFRSAVTDEIRSLILHRAPAYELRKVSVRQGMVSLREDGWRLVREGRTTIEEVIRNTKDEEAVMGVPRAIEGGGAA